MGSARINHGVPPWGGGHCVGVGSLSGSNDVSGAQDLRAVRGVGDVARGHEGV